MFSSGSTLSITSACISEWRFSITLKVPSALISLIGCIKEGLIFILRFSLIIFEISVGLTDP